MGAAPLHPGIKSDPTGVERRGAEMEKAVPALLLFSSGTQQRLLPLSSHLRTRAGGRHSPAPPPPGLPSARIHPQPRLTTLGHCRPSAAGGRCRQSARAEAAAANRPAVASEKGAGWSGPSRARGRSPPLPSGCVRAPARARAGHALPSAPFPPMWSQPQPHRRPRRAAGE